MECLFTTPSFNGFPILFIPPDETFATSSHSTEDENSEESSYGPLPPLFGTELPSSPLSTTPSQQDEVLASLSEYREGHKHFLQLMIKVEKWLTKFRQSFPELDMPPLVISQDLDPKLIPYQCERIYSLKLSLMSHLDTMKREMLAIKSECQVISSEGDILSVAQGLA